MLLRSYKTIISGSVTQANMRISAVDGGSTASGGAFLDFSLAGSLTPYIGDYIVIKDSTGKTIEGWIKAKGVAETLSAVEVYVDPNFDDTSNWNKGVGCSVSGGKGIFLNTPTLNGITSNTSTVTVPGRLMKHSVVIDSIDAGDSLQVAIKEAIWYYYAPADITTIYNTERVAYIYQYLGILAGGNNTGATVDSMSYKQVLTPSATGVTITSLQDGTLYNWSVKTTDFNYNDSSGYTYKIQARLLVGGMGGGYVR